jgi:hypothetical protein
MLGLGLGPRLGLQLGLELVLGLGLGLGLGLELGLWTVRVLGIVLTGDFGLRPRCLRPSALSFASCLVLKL